MQYKTVWRTQSVGSFNLRLLQLESFEQTVDDMIAELERQGKNDISPEDCPYFGQVWAAALGLAETLAVMDLKDKSILEVGCGLALPSIVAAKLGAKCTAIDIHKDVEIFLKENLIANDLQVNAISYNCADWQLFSKSTGQCFDLIIASDVLYENHHPRSLMEFFRTFLAPNGEVLIVDPCRWHHQDFINTLRANNFAVELAYNRTTENNQPVKLAVIRARLKTGVIANNLK